MNSFADRNQIIHDRFALIRDPLGVAPLYYGQTTDGALCFASEVKGVLEFTNQVHVLVDQYNKFSVKLKDTVVNLNGEN